VNEEVPIISKKFICSRHGDLEIRGRHGSRIFLRWSWLDWCFALSLKNNNLDQYCSILQNDNPPHPAGIILNRAEYYTIPTMEELADMTDASGVCKVSDFTIGRIGW